MGDSAQTLEGWKNSQLQNQQNNTTINRRGVIRRLIGVRIILNYGFNLCPQKDLFEVFRRGLYPKINQLK